MIIVSGCEYSGTSLTAGVLHHLGVNMGEIETPQDLWLQRHTHEYVATEGQPRDYLSYQCRTFEHMTRPFLVDGHPGNFYHAEALGECLMHYGLMRTGVWGVKHTALLFLTWYSGLSKLPAKWVLTQRRAEDQMHSCRKYCGDSTGLALWVAAVFGVQRLAYLRLRQQLAETPQVLVVDYELTRRYPRRTIDRLVDYVHITPTAAQVAAALDFVKEG